jgi:hypothetical protein
MRNRIAYLVAAALPGLLNKQIRLASGIPQLREILFR